MTESNPPLPSEEENKIVAHFDNGVIDTLFIKEINFGAILFQSPGIVEDRHNLMLSLEPCQKACKQLFDAAKNGFNHFKVHYKNANLEVQSTWTFHDASVKGIDFGTYSPDQPQVIMCEVTYKHLEIDGVKL